LASACEDTLYNDVSSSSSVERVERRGGGKGGVLLSEARSSDGGAARRRGGDGATFAEDFVAGNAGVGRLRGGGFGPALLVGCGVGVGVGVGVGWALRGLTGGGFWSFCFSLLELFCFSFAFALASLFSLFKTISSRKVNFFTGGCAEALFSWPFLFDFVFRCFPFLLRAISSIIDIGFFGIGFWFLLLEVLSTDFNVLPA